MLWIENITELTDDEHDVLAAKLSSAIAMSRAVQHRCDWFADALDIEMPYTERMLFIRADESVYDSASIAAASIIADSINDATSAAYRHQLVADDMWELLKA